MLSLSWLRSPETGAGLRRWKARAIHRIPTETQPWGEVSRTRNAAGRAIRRNGGENETTVTYYIDSTMHSIDVSIVKSALPLNIYASLLMEPPSSHDKACRRVTVCWRRSQRYSQTNRKYHTTSIAQVQVVA